MGYFSGPTMPGSVEAWCAPFSPSLVADLVISTCGLGRMLQLGAADGAPLSSLLRRSVDVIAVDSDSGCVDRGNLGLPGRFVLGTAFALPFADSSFETVIGFGYLEGLDEHDVLMALREIRRVCARNVLLQIRTAHAALGDAPRTLRSREWWEQLCFSVGFRKHVRYYAVNHYETLDAEGEYIFIVLECVASSASDSLHADLELIQPQTPDMLCHSGIDSDAALVRYQWAASFLRSGERVLDIAAGSGYGCHLLGALSREVRCTGISVHETDVRYAQDHYAQGTQIAFRNAQVPFVLNDYADASVDAVIFFDPVDDHHDRTELLKQCFRVLSPGGRFIGGMRNRDTSDPGIEADAGLEPKRSQGFSSAQLLPYFEVEAVFAQYTGEAGGGGTQAEPFERPGRGLQLCAVDTADMISPEWWLTVAMKSPLVATPDLVHRSKGLQANIHHVSHPSAFSYQNPWLVRALFTIGQRVQSTALLDKWALEVVATSPHDSSDYAAALCAHAYVLLGEERPNLDAVGAALERIDSVLATAAGDALWFRWQVSLSFVKAGLMKSIGRLEAAMYAYVFCGEQDVLRFGVHLATKTSQAWYEAGRIAISLGMRDKAAEYWSRGVELGRMLLSVNMADILIDCEIPNLFNHGDGVREYTLAWDNIARCANGLHLLKVDRPIDADALSASFAEEYAVVTRDVKQARQALAVQTEELTETRTHLVKRTAALRAAAGDLVTRTAELVEVRELLIDRTKRLEHAERALQERSTRLEEMVQEQQLAVSSAHAANLQVSAFQAALETTSRELARLNEEILQMRDLLTERTHRLEGAEQLLQERTALLESAHEQLAGRGS